MAKPMTPGQRAYYRIGEWPAGLGRQGGLARAHAAGAWATARSGVVSTAGTLWLKVDRDLDAFGGQVDLAFLSTLAGHLRRCEDCWKEWIDGETPVQLLTAAVGRRPAGAVFRPLVREMRSAQGRSRRLRGA